jgi:hypothetical protein
LGLLKPVETDGIVLGSRGREARVGMITGELRSRIDRVWDARPGGENAATWWG